LAKWGPYSEKWNLKTYKLVNSDRYGMIKYNMKKFYSDFPNQALTFKAISEFENISLRTLYTISPPLFPKPSNWLDRNPKAVLLTFGSIINPKPKKYSELILNLLIKHKIPTIVNLSWGGLEKSVWNLNYYFT